MTIILYAKVDVGEVYIADPLYILFLMWC